MNDFFKILYNGSDLSKKLKDYGTAPVALTLLVGEFLYIGYSKPFKQLFIELSTKSTAGGILSAEYYNGSSWQPLASLLDETDNFTKSGFLFFEKPDSWKEFEDGGTPKNFYIRLATDTEHTTGTELKGIGILLSNDLDLEGVRSNIVSKHNNGESWVLKHEQARKDIIQEIRNVGNRKVLNADNVNPLVTEGKRYADINEYDLLEPEQLRQASLYKAISMIYLDELSDDIDDKWARQGERYEIKANEMINLFRLQLDTDNDGIHDEEENDDTTHTVLSWK